MALTHGAYTHFRHESKSCRHYHVRIHEVACELRPTKPLPHGWLVVTFRRPSNLVPRVLRLLGQRFGRQERLWGNGIFSIFLIGYSGNNEIGEAEVGSM